MKFAESQRQRLLNNKAVGSFFFQEPTVTVDTYMLEEFAFPELSDL